MFVSNWEVLERTVFEFRWGCISIVSVPCLIMLNLSPCAAPGVFSEQIQFLATIAQSISKACGKWTREGDGHEGAGLIKEGDSLTNSLSNNLIF